MVDAGEFLFIDVYLLKSVEGMIELETLHCEPLMVDLGSHSWSHHRKAPPDGRKGTPMK